LACGAVIATAGIVHVAATALVRPRRGQGVRVPELDRAAATKRRLAALAVGLLKVAAWGGALWLVTEWVPLLRRWRDFSVIVVDMTLTFPLFTIDGRPYSLVELLELPALVGIAWLGIKAASDVTAARVATASGIDAGSLDPAFRLLRYVASFAVALLFIEAWGFDLSSFSAFSTWSTISSAECWSDWSVRSSPAISSASASGPARSRTSARAASRSARSIA
jgi:hypothetical protein